MLLRKFAPVAAKRLGVFLGHQRSTYPPAICPHLKNLQQSLPRNERDSQRRDFRCSPSHSFAAKALRTSSVSARVDVASGVSVSKKKGKGATDVPKISERPVVFECQECEAVSVKRVQQEHLEKGVVMVRCLDCGSVNLAADNLGLFKDKGSMQKFLSEYGVDVRYGAQGSYELLAEDLIKMVEMDQQKAEVQQQYQEATSS